MKRERLSRLIKQSGRAKKELAEELGISTQMLNALIRGNRNPSLELAKKIADVLDSSIEELFFNTKRTQSVSFETKSAERKEIRT